MLLIQWIICYEDQTSNGFFGVYIYLKTSFIYVYTRIISEVIILLIIWSQYVILIITKKNMQYLLLNVINIIISHLIFKNNKKL